MVTSISKRLAVLAALCVFAPWISADDGTAATSPEWGWSNIFKTKFGRSKTPVGIGLYTTRKKSYGVGFRCEKSKLYAFVAVKKVSVRDTMIRGARRPVWWDVAYSLDGAVEAEEEWVSLHNGLMFMVKSRSTSSAIFEAARLGKTLVVRPKNGKTVSIEMPADTTGIFDKYRDRCGLGKTEAVASTASV